MQLFNGDCLEVMKTIADKSIDLIVTDPPYAMNYQSNFRTEKFDKIKNDDVILDEFLVQSKRILKDTGALYYFTRWDKYPEWYEKTIPYFNIKNCIVWYKKGGGLGDLKQGYIYNHEFCFYCPMDDHELNEKRCADVFEYSKDNVNDYVHPTQKPVELIEKIILKSSNKNDVVLDCFMGSGTTGIACQNTQRDFIGIELDKHYFDIASERIKNASAQGMFDFE